MVKSRGPHQAIDIMSMSRWVTVNQNNLLNILEKTEIHLLDIFFLEFVDIIIVR